MVKLRAKNAIVTDSFVIEKAKALAEKLDITDFQFSDGWLWNFKQRHNIKLQRPHGESGATDLEDQQCVMLCVQCHEFTQVERDLTDDELAALVTDKPPAESVEDIADCELIEDVVSAPSLPEMRQQLKS
ncbi:TPA: hypothetical protein ACH3X1_009133 [Trebouxia sp. C0004]